MPNQRLLSEDSREDKELSAIWICAGDDPNTFDSLPRYVDVLADLPLMCELTIVVNGELGASEELISCLQDDHKDDGEPRIAHDVAIQIVHLHRQCDESTAIRAGLEASRGMIIVLLPTYMQSDPNAIVEMISKINEGAHYVASWRNPRIDSRWSSYKSHLFNLCTSAVTGVELHDLNSGLRAMTREVSDQLPIYGDLHRFLPIMAAMQGFDISEVSVQHLKEQRAEKGGRFGVYLRRILDLLTLFFLFKFTKKPLRFFGLFGASSLAIGAMIIAWVTTQRFLGVSMANRPALLLGIVFVVLGVQLFSVGLLGELIIFTHRRHLMKLHVEEIHEVVGSSSRRKP